jgi:hypothetical protein
VPRCGWRLDPLAAPAVKADSVHDAPLPSGPVERFPPRCEPASDHGWNGSVAFIGLTTLQGKRSHGRETNQSAGKECAYILKIHEGPGPPEKSLTSPPDPDLDPRLVPQRGQPGRSVSEMIG